MEHLAGRVRQYTGFHLTARYPNLSRGHVEWLVTASKDATLEATFQAEQAGVVRTAVTVGA